MVLSFPDVDLDLTVEAAFGADLTASPTVWSFTDLSSRRRDDPISIVRGARDGAGQVVASSATMALENNDRMLTPLHPLGGQYPNVIRGLPMRAYRGRPSRGAGGGSASNSTSHIAPSVNSATNNALLVCGWLGGNVGNYTLPGGMTAGPAETDSGSSTMRTAYLAIAAAGATGAKTATHSVSCIHASASVVVHGSPVVVQETLSAVSVTGDLALTTGAGTQAGWWLLVMQGWNFDTYDTMPTAPNDNEGGWIPLADSGRFGPGNPDSVHVRAWVRRVSQAGAQTVRLFGNADNTANHAHVYVLSGVDSWSFRFAQFAAAYNPTFTPKVGGGFDSMQQITTGGILRRAEKGTSPARSPIARQVLSVLNKPFLVDYWPCEDGTDAQSLACASGGQAASMSGAVTPAGYSGFLGSSPIPTLEAGGSISGVVSSMPDGAFAWRNVYFMPGSGVANNQSLVDIYATGTGARWQVIYTTGGGLNLRVLNAAGTLIDQTGASDFSALIHGFRFLLVVEAVQNGANVDVVLFVRRINADNTTTDADTGQVIDSLVAVTIGHPANWTIGTGGALTGCAVGHVMVGNSGRLAFGISQALVGYPGERAGRRLARLSSEERIPFHPIGNMDLTQQMGVQRIGKFVDLAMDCQEADRGILGETRQDFGLFYLALSGLYNRSAALTIDLATYRNGVATSPKDVFKPVYDDQSLRNDIEVSREGGSSVRVQDAASQAQGIFDDSAQLRNFADTQLAAIAAWMLRLGTIDDYRYPAVPIDLGANPGLITAWESLDIGAKMVRTNPPDPHPPGAISQALFGYTEIIRPRSWLIAAFCAPWVFDAGMFGTAGVVSRYDSANSRLVSGAAAGVTTLSVVTDAWHALWVTGSGGPTFSFDVACAGIRLPVSAIASSLMEAFTRSVSNSWGTAPNGQTWGNSGGAASEYFTTGSLGRHSHPAVNVLHHSFIETGSADHETKAEVLIPVVPTGAPITVRVAGRFTDINNYYEAQLVINTTGVVVLTLRRRVAGAGAQVGTASITLLSTHSAGNVWIVQLSCQGSLLRCKARKVGDPETDWLIVETDSSLTTGSQIGCLSRLEAGNTNTLSVAIDWDNIDISNPQTFTVARNADGIDKALNSGDQVRLWNPARYGL